MPELKPDLDSDLVVSLCAPADVGSVTSAKSLETRARRIAAIVEAYAANYKAC